MLIVEKKTKDLKPYRLNAKLHPKTQIIGLAQSIKSFGFVQPIVVDRSGTVIIGHARLEAAKRLKMEAVPALVLEDLTEEQVRALRLADNRLAETGWDFDILRKEFEEFNFDFEPFNIEFQTLIGNEEDDDDSPIQAKQVKEFPSFSEAQIEQMVRNEIESMDADQLIRNVMTPALAAAQFNALCEGKETGYWISALFNPHRLAVCCKKSKKWSLYSSIKNKNQNFIKMGARFITKFYGGNVHPNAYIKHAGSGWGGVQVAGEFRPSIAQKLVRRYLPKGGRVLDPCHGWGGRVIGVLATMLPIEYVGYDPAPETFDGVKNLIKFLMGAKKVKGKALTYCKAFEDAELKGKFDFIFTSPPYFDIEDYTDANEAVARRYANYQEFEEGFLKCLVEKSARHLAKNGHIVFNIGSIQYDMAASLKKICSDLGLNCKRIEGFGIGGDGLAKRTNSGGRSDGEPFFEITK